MANGLLDNLNLNIPEFNRLATNISIKDVDKTATNIVNQLPGVLAHIALALAMILAGWWVSTWLASRIQDGLVRMRVEETLAAFLGSMLRFAIFFTVFLTALKFIGFNSTSMAAVLGATGLAVGLAMKGTLGHVASGMMLMVHRPFKVGDWIQSGDFSGTVKRIGLFSTELNTHEFVRVFIPNTLLWENTLQNYTYNRMRMMKFTLRLPLGVDVARALDVMRATIDADPLILKTPEPKLGVDSYSAYGAECIVWVWVRTEDYGAVRYSLLITLQQVLRKAGFDLAYPQQVIHYTGQGQQQEDRRARPRPPTTYAPAKTVKTLRRKR